MVRAVGNSDFVQTELTKAAFNFATRLRFNILSGGHVESGAMLRSVSVEKSRHRPSGVVDRTVSVDRNAAIPIEYGHWETTEEGRRIWIEGTHVMRETIREMRL